MKLFLKFEIIQYLLDAIENNTELEIVKNSYKFKLIGDNTWIEFTSITSKRPKLEEVFWLGYYLKDYLLINDIKF